MAFFNERGGLPRPLLALAAVILALVFAGAGCSTSSQPARQASASTTLATSRLNGTYAISLPPNDQSCGSPSLSNETLTINGTSATVTPVDGGSPFTGTATVTGSTFAVHVTNGISDAPGAITVDLNGSLESGGVLSGQSKNSGIYPGGQQGFGCNFPFTASRSGVSAPTTAPPTSTAASSIPKMTSTTIATAAGTPSCTVAALTAAAQAAGVPNVDGVDPNGYGCSGTWAYAGVDLGDQEEVTWTFMAVNGSWQRTIVQLDCQDRSSSPTLPPSILQAECNAN